MLTIEPKAPKLAGDARPRTDAGCPPRASAVGSSSGRCWGASCGRAVGLSGNFRPLRVFGQV